MIGGEGVCMPHAGSRISAPTRLRYQDYIVRPTGMGLCRVTGGAKARGRLAVALHEPGKWCFEFCPARAFSRCRHSGVVSAYRSMQLRTISTQRPRLFWVGLPVQRGLKTGHFGGSRLFLSGAAR